MASQERGERGKEREGEKTFVCLGIGGACRARSQAHVCMCGREKGPLRIKGGSSFTDVLFPGACSTRSAEFLRCSHSQMAGAY